MFDVSNLDDIIDSRDIIKRIEELQADQTNDDVDATELEELASLLRLQEECADYVEDWTYGATLVRDSYFKAYAEELADELGTVPADVSWPLTCIDWDQAASELQYDYTAVDFDGIKYWVR